MECRPAGTVLYRSCDLASQHFLSWRVCRKPLAENLPLPGPLCKYVAHQSEAELLVLLRLAWLRQGSPSIGTFVKWINAVSNVNVTDLPLL